MTIIELGLAAYALITLFAFIMTYLEQRRTGQRTPIFNLIGYAACTVWPVVIAVVILTKSMRQA